MTMTREEKINTLIAVIQECEDYQWERKEILFEIIKDLEQETVSKESYDHEYFLRKELEMEVEKLKLQLLKQQPKKGEWLRMSELSEQEDDRYKCSRCGNVIHHKDKMNLYTFNSWCGRCGSDNGRKIEVTV